MASSGHFDPSQTYDSYKAVEIHDPACTECLAKGKDCFKHYNPRSSKCHYCYIGEKLSCQTGRQVSNVRRYLWITGSRQRDVARWTNFGRPLPVGGRPIYANAEGSDELDGEKVELVPHSAGHPVNSSTSNPPAKRLQSHIIHNTPRNFQPTLATIPTSIPPASYNPSHTRPALNQAVRPSPILQPRNSPMVASQKPHPVASISRRREELSPLLFPAAQVFQCQHQSLIQVTREDPNTEIENQDAVARLFRRVDRNTPGQILCQLSAIDFTSGKRQAG
ncbi:hypothetical protein O181_075749 [Austropuccinia psidii MF-1]|uniref:Uncharacterized protein n=1 Tax=Austropuccinia psidii MF-1 TaxID=1389203 RepID=A0A9Q3IER9_9BASI|nr:hypothetical protein [Austropuccinia psidii MF-1]